MPPKPTLIPFIPRFDTRTGEAVLFFPDYPANLGHIVCYVHTGQHGEAEMAYMMPRTTRIWVVAASKDDDTAMRALIREYAEHYLDDGELMMHCRRDMPKFRQQRWQLARKGA